MSAPERGSVRREAPPPPPPLSTIERIVRYAEKDDLLLYITAVFGVLMPAFMYLLYKHIHAKYHDYAQKKRVEAKLKRRKALPKIRIYYADSEADGRRAAYCIADSIDAHEPMVVNLHSLKVDDFLQAGISVFVIERDSESRDYRRLCEWMQKMRFEMRRKSLLSGTTYCVVEVSGAESTSGKKPLQEVLYKALASLDAKPIDGMDVVVGESEELENLLEKWSQDFIAWYKCCVAKKRQAPDDASGSEETCSSLSEESEMSADDEYTRVDKKTD